MLSFLAIEMMIAAVFWQVFRLTRSEFDLGLVGLAQFTPFVLLFLVAGVVVDRVPRMRIIRAAITIQALCALGLFSFTLAGGEQFLLILLILVLFGVSRAFHGPAQQAVVPNLVSKEDFPNAVAWSTSGFQIARILGPTVTGGLIPLGTRLGVDETLVYGVAAVIFIVATGFAWSVRNPAQIVNRDPVNIANLLAGLRFILSRKVILGAVSLDLFAVLFGGALALLPVYATEILDVGPEGFGLLRSAFAVGALCGGLYLAQIPIRKGAGVKLLTAVGVFGSGVIVFGVSETFLLSLAALVVMGMGDSVSVFIRQNMVQIITPDAMRGRVSAVSSVFTNASNELGEFESGVTAHWWGTVPAVVVGGAATLAVAVSFAWLFPQLRKVDSLDADDLIRRYRDPAPKP